MHYKPIPLQDLSQSKTLAQYCFVTQPGTDRDMELTHLIEQEAGLGGYVGSELVSQLYAIPFDMNVFGVRMPMGGIATVSTYPEYRQGGHTKELLLKSLEVMREKGQLLSVLAPFTESFYRHFGWEVFFENSSYSIPIEQTQMRHEEKGRVIRFDPDDTKRLRQVQQFHNRIVPQHNGLTYRDEAWWERLHNRQGGSTYAVHLDEANEIRGYLRYRIKAPEFQVLDLYALDAKTERVLWNYVSLHSSQVEKVVGYAPAQDSFAVHFMHPDFERETFFDKMIRIVDVAAFLTVYPFRSSAGPLYVEVTDEHAPWNNQVFKIEPNGTITKPKQVAEEKLLRMDIGPFSAMMVGYHDLDWYRYHGYAKATDKVVALWKEALPSGFPSFHENF